MNASDVSVITDGGDIRFIHTANIICPVCHNGFQVMCDAGSPLFRPGSDTIKDLEDHIERLYSQLSMMRKALIDAQHTRI
jgi:hypothetical protein